MGKKNNKIGVVYSTNPDFEYTYEEDDTVESLPPHKQTLKIQLDKNYFMNSPIFMIQFSY